MKTNNKKPSALKLWLLRVIPTALIGTLTMAASCGKEPQPTPPTPTPEPIPTRTVSMDMTWYEIFHGQLADKGIADTLKDPTVQTLEMRLVYPEDENVFGETSSGFSTKNFHRGRDTLQNYSNLSDNLRYSGTIIVHSEGGAQQPSVTEGTGMALEDSIWYASKGFQIKRYDPSATISK